MAVYAEMTASVYEARSVEELFEIYQKVLLKMCEVNELSKSKLLRVENIADAKEYGGRELQETLEKEREETIEWRKGCEQRIEQLKAEQVKLQKVLDFMKTETAVELSAARGISNKIRTDLVSMCDRMNDISMNHTRGSPEELIDLASEIEARLRLYRKSDQKCEPLKKSPTRVYADSSKNSGFASRLSSSVERALVKLRLLPRTNDVTQLQLLLDHFSSGSAH
ncbi:hypothetical protein QR680_009622 [Steinernema hermaphroditum]|uniref:Uncharacterized protein n=1 Tax=Steinernema hermaphroditum TaxID=289476 RepID=A0AA39M988_9BILA|nr:hypothetical protein QR680_009622 [Steinernema hermaphroditum]